MSFISIVLESFSNSNNKDKTTYSNLNLNKCLTRANIALTGFQHIILKHLIIIMLLIFNEKKKKKRVYDYSSQFMAWFNALKSISQFITHNLHWHHHRTPHKNHLFPAKIFINDRLKTHQYFNKSVFNRFV